MTDDEIERLARERGGTVTGVNLGALPRAPETAPFDLNRMADERISEKEFDAELVKYAKERGWETYHTHDSRRSRAGWPDRAFWRDRFFLAELKAPNGQLTPEQRETIDQLRRAGVTVYVWKPEDWPTIRAVLA